MREDSKTALVIRYKDYDDEYVYVGGLYNGQYDTPSITGVYEFDDAMDFSEQPKEHIVQVYDQFQNENEERDVELVRITVKTTIEDITEDDEEFKELRQKSALAKLTERDIKALGLVPIAVYIKTKFHNS